MDEKPTVQMDSYPEEESRKGDFGAPSTVPIDDLFQEQEWPSHAPPGRAGLLDSQEQSRPPPTDRVMFATGKGQ